MSFSKSDINIDVEQTTQGIIRQMREIVSMQLHKHGAVVGISGGIDSSVCFALSVKAFSPERVLGVAMPEKDSNPDSIDLAKNLAGQYGAEFIMEELTDA